ncbi:MAG: iron-sulfur cluster assembly accessory protein [Candidatus Algichlamydia australiensis]|nr:iron-sulfur cluster assembly accessory protein [Chlamydiales bacterium]
MTIAEIFENFPQKSQKLAQELTRHGLQCVGCSAATWETLEAGVLSHGKSLDDLQDLLTALNAILEGKLDDSTITMTEAAANKFRKVLAEENKEHWALRFGDKPGGCSGYEYVLDFSEKSLDTDQVFTSHGIEIHVDKTMVERLLGCEIDYQEGLMGSGFKISNPNVKSSCSCGSSQNY